MNLPRRSRLTAAAAAITSAAAQTQRDWTGHQPLRYPDTDIVALHPSFEKYKIGSAAIERLHTGARWAEGPAWNAQGNFLLWSDIPNNRQFRRLEEDGHVAVYREPSGYSNGSGPYYVPKSDCSGLIVDSNISDGVSYANYVRSQVQEP